MRRPKLTPAHCSECAPQNCLRPGEVYREEDPEGPDASKGLQAQEGPEEGQEEPEPEEEAMAKGLSRTVPNHPDS